MSIQNPPATFPIAIPTQKSQFSSMDSHLPSLLSMAMVKGLGPVTAKNLISYCGGPEAVLKAPKSQLFRIPGIGRKIIDALKKPEIQDAATREIDFCEKNDIEILTYLDPAYPNSLKYTHDGPLVLFKKGKAQFNDQPSIAIVGTRKATDYGREQAERFASFFAERGINVVSGLAYGIDITAHRATVRNNGITTAVLAHGFDQIYPSVHTQKANEILKDGAWVTEYASYTKLDPGNFPARNRIISGMSKAVVIIEAAKSGGALITAKFAFGQNREVYALPGSLQQPYSEGCNNLIRDNIAKLVTDPQEILDDLEISWEPAKASGQLDLELALPNLPLSEDETIILTYLNRGEARMDSIAMNTKIPVSQLNALLLTMEFRGLLKQMPGKRFKRL